MPRSSAGSFLLGRIPSSIRAKEYFQNYVLDAHAETALKRAAREDARNYVYNAAISFLSAMGGLRTQQAGWAITKLYYCAFYIGRASLCRADHIIFHAPKFPANGNTQYEIKILAGQRAAVTKNPSTHKQVAIKFQQFGYPPFMRGLTIDSTDPISWLMDKREYWQYRAARFPDPDFPQILDKIEMNKTQRLLEEYSTDTSGVYLADPAHAILSVPFRLLIWALSQGSLISPGCISEKDIMYLRKRCHVGKHTLTTISRHLK